MRWLENVLGILGWLALALIVGEIVAVIALALLIARAVDALARVVMRKERWLS